MASEADFTSLLNDIASESSTPIPGQTLLPNGKKTKGRVKIKMEYIGNKLRRYTTFSKRKTGIMKKAYELSTLTGTQVMLLVASETGHVYAFATNKLKPMIASDAGRSLIQSCLNTPDEAVADVGACKTEFTFEPPSGSAPAGTARKRKIQETETLCLPTMVSSGSTHSTSPMNVEDYCDSDNDSETNESPDTLMDSFDEPKSPVPPAADPELLQRTLKDALRAAGLQRQNVMNKKPKFSTQPVANSPRNQPKKPKKENNDTPNMDPLASLLPFMLQGLSNQVKQEERDDEADKILYQVPQGVVYASDGNSNDGGLNGVSNNQGNGEENNLLPTLFPGAFGNLSLPQVLAATAFLQLADVQNSLKS